jgi:hypothetical protein
VPSRRDEISPETFRELTRSVVGLPVNGIWRGAGTAIFLELGELSPPPPKGGQPRGEASLMIEWTWRVEGKHSVAFGAWSTEGRINRGLENLKGRVVEDVFVTGRLPELYVRLSGERWLHSFMIAEGELLWALKLIDESWLSVEKGKLLRKSH